MSLIAIHVNLLGDCEALVVLLDGGLYFFGLVALLVEELIAGEKKHAQAALVVLVEKVAESRVIALGKAAVASSVHNYHHLATVFIEAYFFAGNITSGKVVEALVLGRY